MACAGSFHVAFESSGLGCSPSHCCVLRTRRPAARPAPLHRDIERVGGNRRPALACRPPRRLHRRSRGRLGAGSDLGERGSRRFCARRRRRRERGRRLRSQSGNACGFDFGSRRQRHARHLSFAGWSGRLSDLRALEDIFRTRGGGACRRRGDCPASAESRIVVAGQAGLLARLTLYQPRSQRDRCDGASSSTSQGGARHLHCQTSNAQTLAQNIRDNR
jgi:hypothetical protein